MCSCRCMCGGRRSLAPPPPGRVVGSCTRSRFNAPNHQVTRTAEVEQVQPTCISSWQESWSFCCRGSPDHQHVPSLSFSLQIAGLQLSVHPCKPTTTTGGGDHSTQGGEGARWPPHICRYIYRFLENEEGHIWQLPPTVLSTGGLAFQWGSDCTS